eukprot:gene11829-24802_t
MTRNNSKSDTKFYHLPTKIYPQPTTIEASYKFWAFLHQPSLEDCLDIEEYVINTLTPNQNKIPEEQSSQDEVSDQNVSCIPNVPGL